jgi:hypothetical protein
VGVDFADGADAFGGAPGIFFGGHGFGEASVALLVVGDFGEEFAADAGDGGSGGGLILSRGAMREKRYGRSGKKNGECETTHGNLRSLVRGKPGGFYNGNGRIRRKKAV